MTCEIDILLKIGFEMARCRLTYPSLESIETTFQAFQPKAKILKSCYERFCIKGISDFAKKYDTL